MYRPVFDKFIRVWYSFFPLFIKEKSKFEERKEERGEKIYLGILKIRLYIKFFTT